MQQTMCQLFLVQISLNRAQNAIKVFQVARNGLEMSRRLLNPIDDPIQAEAKFDPVGENRASSTGDRDWLGHGQLVWSWRKEASVTAAQQG